jgi:hypothetical protein
MAERVPWRPCRFVLATAYGGRSMSLVLSCVASEIRSPPSIKLDRLLLGEIESMGAIGNSKSCPTGGVGKLMMSPPLFQVWFAAGFSHGCLRIVNSTPPPSVDPRRGRATRFGPVRASLAISRRKSPGSPVRPLLRPPSLPDPLKRRSLPVPCHGS